jgi:hypothetical protein
MSSLSHYKILFSIFPDILISYCLKIHTGYFGPSASVRCLGTKCPLLTAFFSLLSLGVFILFLFLNMSLIYFILRFNVVQDITKRVKRSPNCIDKIRQQVIFTESNV